jgi:cellulose biosynthesis protein BcsQ
VKVILATGIDSINSFIKELEGVKIIDECTDLELLKEIIQYSGIDTIIINRYLDESDEGEAIKKVVRDIREKNKDIRFVILLGQYETKFISSMVNIGIYDLIIGEETSSELIEDILKNPRKEFDFNKYLAVKKEEAKQKVRVEVVEKVQSVFKRVFAVYSPLSEGSSKVAAHLAVALARAKKCKVCLIDGNPLKPRQKEIFGLDSEYSLGDALDSILKGSLTQDRIDEIVVPSKHRNLDVLLGLYDMNDYYASNTQQYEKLIDALKRVYDYVVVDTHSWFDVLATDASLRKADKVLLPVRGCTYSLNELRRYLDTFEKYNDFDIGKFGIVVNQYSGKDLTSFEIEAKMNYPILGYISKHILYQEKNAFKSTKLMNEYVDILNAVNIEAKKKRNLMDFFHVTSLFKRGKNERKEKNDKKEKSE